MNQRRIENLLAYIVFGVVAIALIVKYLLVNVFEISTSITVWFDRIAYWLTAIATLISAFSYAKSRRNGVFMVLLIVFLAVIVVFTFVL